MYYYLEVHDTALSAPPSKDLPHSDSECREKIKKGGGRNQIPKTKSTRNTLPGLCFTIKENSRTCVVISLERRVFG